MTVALCTSACKSAGYSLSGVEYAGECYCGNAFVSPGGPASDGFTGCSMLCNGNSSEYCGGPNRLDVYSLGAASSTSSTKTSSTSTTATSVTTSSAATALPSGWTYKGCYIDGANGRIINDQLPDSATLTVESCVASCVGLGYTVAGMEYSQQCFCGNYTVNGATLAPADTDCSMPCSGNSKEFCGAGNRMSIYSKGTLQIYQPPAVQTTSLPGSWQYQGCIS
jgi:WSC domain